MAKQEEQADQKRVSELEREGRRRGGKKNSTSGAGSDDGDGTDGNGNGDGDGLVGKKGKMRTAQGNTPSHHPLFCTSVSFTPGLT
jgi:hypothetical protein